MHRRTNHPYLVGAIEHRPLWGVMPKKEPYWPSPRGVWIIRGVVGTPWRPPFLPCGGGLMLYCCKVISLKGCILAGSGAQNQLCGGLQHPNLGTRPLGPIYPDDHFTIPFVLGNFKCHVFVKWFLWKKGVFCCVWGYQISRLGLTMIPDPMQPCLINHFTIPFLLGTFYICKVISLKKGCILAVSQPSYHCYGTTGIYCC